VEKAKLAVHRLVPAFPDIFASVKTQMASSVLLHSMRVLIEESSDTGCINERQREGCATACDEAVRPALDGPDLELALPP
jgi:hypothetical protein